MWTEQHVFISVCFPPQEPAQKRRTSSTNEGWWSPTVCTGWWRTDWCLSNRPGPPSRVSPCWTPLRSDVSAVLSCHVLCLICLNKLRFVSWMCFHVCPGPGVWLRQRGVPVAWTGCFPQQEDCCSPADSSSVGWSLRLQQLSSQSTGSHAVQPLHTSVSSHCRQ